MGFFQRNRETLAARGIDPDRLPPGQYATDRFPVLHSGSVPDVDLATWDFTVDGLVGNPLTLSWDQFRALPSRQIVADIHCVTKWSRFDTEWEGVPVSTIWDMIDPDPTGRFVLVRAEHGFTANLPVGDFVRDGNLFAFHYGGAPLEPDHGWPLRLVVPHLYFWKSVKWVRGFTVLADDEPGFWERNGYHMHGDPFLEQRHWGD
jgi:DMSO/TMAO reductase YedYZ molybdopterin-dependent catalytic subunit